MEAFRIVGGARLAGEVRVTGAKNSVLKLMAMINAVCLGLSALRGCARDAESGEENLVMVPCRHW